MTQGVVYGQYYLLGRLAMGGMAEVFLAKSLDGSRKEELLALKRTLPQFAAQTDFVQMFADEAKIARDIHHPNVCQVYDEGRAGDQLYIVMEFIHGKDLKVVEHRANQRNEPIPARFVAFVVSKIATALDHAHKLTGANGEARKIVHRDISPQNILLSYDGIPKLIDFGIAKAKDRIAKTRVGIVKGKFAYMSPEQAVGAEIDYRTDIFALGVTLYELLTGQLPFKGDSDFSTLKRIAKGEYTPPQQVASDLPPRLIRIIERALAKDRNARYASAAEMGSDLERFLVDDGRQVTEATLSAFMRRLFREDYIRESTRLKDFKSMQPPLVTAPAPTPRAAKRDSLELIEDPDFDFDDSTLVKASANLAAGFEGEVTGLTDLLEPEDAPVPKADAGPGEGFEHLTTSEILGPAEFEERTKQMMAPIPAGPITEPNPTGAGDFEEKTRQVSGPAIRAALGGSDFLDDTTDEVSVQRAAEALAEASHGRITGPQDVPRRGDIEQVQKLASIAKLEEEPTERDEEIDLADIELDTTDHDGDLPAPPTAAAPSPKDFRVPSEPEFSVPSDLLEPPDLDGSDLRRGLLTAGERRALMIAAGAGVLVVYGSYHVAAHGMPSFAAELLRKLSG